MIKDWSIFFDQHGTKRVSDTDKSRGAYVPSKEQRAAITAAGIAPSVGGSGVTIAIETLFDTQNPVLATTYYNSTREGSGRSPETRMGRGIINWANVGDVIVIGNIGNRVLAAKTSVDPPINEVAYALSSQVSAKLILAKAGKATGKPARKDRRVRDFVRNPYVVAAALLRAAGKCEMPQCSRLLFKRKDGSVFLEVHHVVPLAEGGDDTLVNAAALCPMCHRELHYGAKRKAKRRALTIYVASV